MNGLNKFYNVPGENHPHHPDLAVYYSENQSDNNRRVVYYQSGEYLAVYS